MEITVYNQKGEEQGKFDLPEEIFNVAFRPQVVHQAIVSQAAGARQRLALTKGRSEARGGGRKPWRQKGTGRARHGSIRSPIWRGGGVTFGPTEEKNFAKKINKKAKRKALLMALSSKACDQEIILLDNLALEQGKTKRLLEVLKILSDKTKKELAQSVLLVMPTSQPELVRAGKNLAKVKVARADSLNPFDVMKHKHLIIAKEAIEVIKRTYLAENSVR